MQLAGPKGRQRWSLWSLCYLNKPDCLSVYASSRFGCLGLYAAGRRGDLCRRPQGTNERRRD